MPTRTRSITSVPSCRRRARRAPTTSSGIIATRQPAAIVAIQPSTGNLLAVAQNAPADAQGPIALTGLYVAYANRHHDAQMAAILKDHGA